MDKTTGAARFYDRMIQDIEGDLGGKRMLSRIESELIAAFAGAATELRYLTHQVLLAEGSEIDLAGYATLASTMLRIGARLGLRRRPRDAAILDPLEYAARQDEAAQSATPATGEEIDPKTKEPIPRTRINVVRILEKDAPAARGWF